MDNIDLTRDEFERLFRGEEAGLDAASRDVLRRHAVPTFRVVYEFDGVAGRSTSPVWVVAKSGCLVLGYDEAEEEYGIGTLRDDRTVDDWGTYGERLGWTLSRFPTSGDSNM